MEAVATPLAGKPLFSNKALKKLIFPLVIEQFLAISVGFCDTVMISGLGDEAISGVSLVDMIMTLMINVFAALATGGAVVAAQFIGAKRAKDARNSASQLIFIAFIISIVLMALTLVFKAQLLRLFFSTLEEGVMQSALTYFWISALSFPFLAIYNCCAALFRAMGNSKNIDVSLAHHHNYEHNRQRHSHIRSQMGCCWRGDILDYFAFCGDAPPAHPPAQERSSDLYLD